MIYDMYNNKICNSKQISNCHLINVTAVRQNIRKWLVICIYCHLKTKNTIGNVKREKRTSQ